MSTAEFESSSRKKRKQRSRRNDDGEASSTEFNIQSLLPAHSASYAASRPVMSYSDCVRAGQLAVPKTPALYQIRDHPGAIDNPGVQGHYFDKVGGDYIEVQVQKNVKNFFAGGEDHKDNIIEECKRIGQATTIALLKCPVIFPYLQDLSNRPNIILLFADPIQNDNNDNSYNNNALKRMLPEKGMATPLIVEDELVNQFVLLRRIPCSLSPKGLLDILDPFLTYVVRVAVFLPAAAPLMAASTWCSEEEILDVKNYRMMLESDEVEDKHCLGLNTAAKLEEDSVETRPLTYSVLFELAHFEREGNSPNAEAASAWPDSDIFANEDMKLRIDPLAEGQKPFIYRPPAAVRAARQLQMALEKGLNLRTNSIPDMISLGAMISNELEIAPTGAESKNEQLLRREREFQRASKRLFDGDERKAIVNFTREDAPTKKARQWVEKIFSTGDRDHYNEVNKFLSKQNVYEEGKIDDPLRVKFISDADISSARALMTAVTSGLGYCDPYYFQIIPLGPARRRRADDTRSNNDEVEVQSECLRAFKYQMPVKVEDIGLCCKSIGLLGRDLRDDGKEAGYFSRSLKCLRHQAVHMLDLEKERNRQVTTAAATTTTTTTTTTAVVALFPGHKQDSNGYNEDINHSLEHFSYFKKVFGVYEYNEEASNDSCVICMSAIGSTPTITLPCHHCFHIHCYIRNSVAIPKKAVSSVAISGRPYYEQPMPRTNAEGPNNGSEDRQSNTNGRAAQQASLDHPPPLRDIADGSTDDNLAFPFLQYQRYSCPLCRFCFSGIVKKQMKAFKRWMKLRRESLIRRACLEEMRHLEGLIWPDEKGNLQKIAKLEEYLEREKKIPIGVALLDDDVWVNDRKETLVLLKKNVRKRTKKNSDDLLKERAKRFDDLARYVFDNEHLSENRIMRAKIIQVIPDALTLALLSHSIAQPLGPGALESDENSTLDPCMAEESHSLNNNREEKDLELRFLNNRRQNELANEERDFLAVFFNNTKAMGHSSQNNVTSKARIEHDPFISELFEAFTKNLSADLLPVDASFSEANSPNLFFPRLAETYFRILDSNEFYSSKSDNDRTFEDFKKALSKMVKCVLYDHDNKANAAGNDCDNQVLSEIDAHYKKVSEHPFYNMDQVVADPFLGNVHATDILANSSDVTSAGISSCASCGYDLLEGVRTAHANRDKGARRDVLERISQFDGHCRALWLCLTCCKRFCSEKDLEQQSTAGVDEPLSSHAHDHFEQTGHSFFAKVKIHPRNAQAPIHLFNDKKRNSSVNSLITINENFLLTNGAGLALYQILLDVHDLDKELSMVMNTTHAIARRVPALINLKETAHDDEDLIYGRFDREAAKKFVRQAFSATRGLALHPKTYLLAFKLFKDEAASRKNIVKSYSEDLDELVEGFITTRNIK